MSWKSEDIFSVTKVALFCQNEMSQSRKAQHNVWIFFKPLDYELFYFSFIFKV